MADRSLARRVLETEAAAILALVDRLDERFDCAVQLLRQCKGRVILTGMGKSGIICRKIAATLTSTGTPALFLHPAEAVHGDLGVIQSDDVVVALSYSGETDELLQLPGAGDGVTSGLAEYIEPLASAGVAAGVDGVFLEVHEEPARARSDAQNALRPARVSA